MKYVSSTLLSTWDAKLQCDVTHVALPRQIQRFLQEETDITDTTAQALNSITLQASTPSVHSSSSWLRLLILAVRLDLSSHSSQPYACVSSSRLLKSPCVSALKLSPAFGNLVAEERLPFTF